MSATKAIARIMMVATLTMAGLPAAHAAPAAQSSVTAATAKHSNLHKVAKAPSQKKKGHRKH